MASAPDSAASEQELRRSAGAPQGVDLEYQLPARVHRKFHDTCRELKIDPETTLEQFDRRRYPEKVYWKWTSGISPPRSSTATFWPARQKWGWIPINCHRRFTEKKDDSCHEETTHAIARNFINANPRPGYRGTYVRIDSYHGFF